MKPTRLSEVLQIRSERKLKKRLRAVAKARGVSAGHVAREGIKKHLVAEEAAIEQEMILGAST